MRNNRIAKQQTPIWNAEMSQERESERARQLAEANERCDALYYARKLCDSYAHKDATEGWREEFAREYPVQHRLLELSRLAAERSNAEHAEMAEARAKRIVALMEDELYDERDGEESAHGRAVRSASAGRERTGR